MAARKRIEFPVFFEKGDTQMEEALLEQSDLVLIVPCEEGEEVDYVANDPYLKKFVQSDEDGTPRNVLSAARAKGLEFLRVALYGWSSRDEAIVLAKMMHSPSEYEVSIDKRLGLEYFMNNLYVAASRAQRRLFVIDEKKSRDTLWWFASDEQHLLEVLRDLPQRTPGWGIQAFLSGVFRKALVKIVRTLVRSRSDSSVKDCPKKIVIC